MSRRLGPLLITGATGTLGRAFARVAGQRGQTFRLTTRQQLDVADPASVSHMLEKLHPWAVVNTAGYVRVDQAEEDADRCRRENSDGPAVLAGDRARTGIPDGTFS